MPFGELPAGILAGVVGFAVACGGSVIGPENQMEVADSTDRFQFQATATPGPGPSASSSPP